MIDEKELQELKNSDAFNSLSKDAQEFYLLLRSVVPGDCFTFDFEEEDEEC